MSRKQLTEEQRIASKERRRQKNRQYRAKESAKLKEAERKRRLYRDPEWRAKYNARRREAYANKFRNNPTRRPSRVQIDRFLDMTLRQILDLAGRTTTRSTGGDGGAKAMRVVDVFMGRLQGPSVEPAAAPPTPPSCSEISSPSTSKVSQWSSKVPPSNSRAWTSRSKASPSSSRSYKVSASPRYSPSTAPRIDSSPFGSVFTVNRSLHSSASPLRLASSASKPSKLALPW